ncbi:MAG: hypothetical protein ABEJ22_06490 [Haloferacaceae archaeon]
MTRETGEPTVRGGLGDRTAGLTGAASPASVRTVAGSLAAAAALSVTSVRLTANAPVAVPLVNPAAAFGPVHAASVAVCALAAVALALVAPETGELVGLAAAGVFGLLSVVSPAAAVPAVGAIAAGAVLAVASRASVPGDYAEARRLVPVAALVAGLVVSVAAVAPTPLPLRRVGGTLALAGLALLPVTVEADRATWSVAVAVAGLALVAGLGSPFVTGAVVLVVGGVVGAAFPLVAAALGGVAATAVGSLRRGRHLPLLGALLLAAAGAPATVQRALAALLGIVLVSHHALDFDSGAHT